MKSLSRIILESHEKFQTNLNGEIVLTEAATGNYVCTPILAALAGAKVFAIAKASKFGSIDQIQFEVLTNAKELNVNEQISIIRSFDEIDIGEIDIVTNTGFVRPIDKNLINKLKPDCVIPLMWEPWELRPLELDLDSAVIRGIKVYGSNESDPRLQTMSRIGLTVLFFLLKEKRSPFNSKILIIGCKEFISAIEVILNKLNYSFFCFLTDDYKRIEITNFDTIVVAEHLDTRNIIGNTDNCLIKSESLTAKQLVIHIAGNVSFNNMICKHYPKKPAPFGFMSYSAEFIDPLAVIDLHAAGLKVAEGMLKAKLLGLRSKAFKDFMEVNYPALAFKNEKYW